MSYSIETLTDDCYVKETEEWYPRLLRVVKAVPEYNNAAWLLSYQIRSVLQTAKKID
jgi:GTP pyrophosphokinase